MIDPTEEAIRRGQRAQDILTDPLFVEAVDAAKAAIVAAWSASDAADKDGREGCYHRLRALEMVLNDLRHTMANGQMAAHEVEQDNARRKAAKRREDEEFRP